MPKKAAFVFPGQGSQRVGMLDVLSQGGTLARLLDAAEGLSGLPLRSMAAGHVAGDLSDTRAAQPLLYLADLAWAEKLALAGVHPTYVAGHSLGEFAALAFAGVFSPEAGLELVCERSRLMASAASATPGGMAAVLGLESDVVAAAVADLSGVWVANDNAPGQVVLSGTHPGLEVATRALLEAGARKVVPLAVAGAFHSPLMVGPAERFGALLGATAFNNAAIAVISNTDPTPATDGAVLRDRLRDQMVSPVRWTETMHALVSEGVQTLVETGPGAVLTGLARRIEGLEALAVESAGVDGVLEVVRA